MNKTILYIPIIDSINIDNIQNFLNNPENIINQIKPPKPTLSNFCQKLNSKVFTFNLIEVQECKSLNTSSTFGSSKQAKTHLVTMNSSFQRLNFLGQSKSNEYFFFFLLHL